MREFKVNKYITLKLENNETIIYVNSERFDQCKFLLLNIPVNEIKSFDEIESIDEAAEKLDKSMEMERKKLEIPLETEFWGHCSNLQVWAENNYDTRILHRTIAFPLLKRLSEVGDLIAKKVFKEEIKKRLECFHPSVVNYLLSEGFISYLNINELYLILKTPNSKLYKNLVKIIDYEDSSAFLLLKELIKLANIGNISINVREFNVNAYITLRLKYSIKKFLHYDYEYEYDIVKYKESWDIEILVNGERFAQCIFPFLNIFIDEIKSINELESIDEASTKYNHLIEEIPPKIKFWGYCSNFQVWVENDYHTRLLHCTIAFPLLKKLTEVGDPIAKKVFKKEIIKRLKSFYPSVVGFLWNERYLEYLNKNELTILLEDSNSKLHQNLFKSSKYEISFTLPFLRKLTNMGISIAKKILKEEILKRLEDPENDITSHLFSEGYIFVLDIGKLEALNKTHFQIILGFKEEKRFEIIDTLIKNLFGQNTEKGIWFLKEKIKLFEKLSNERKNLELLLKDLSKELNNFTYPENLKSKQKGLVKSFHLTSNFDHSGGVKPIIFSPDGKYFITGSNHIDDGSLKIRVMKTGEIIRMMDGHRRDVTSLAISSDGKYLVSGSTDETIKIWDFKSGVLIRTIKNFSIEGWKHWTKKQVISVGISKDSKYIFSTGRDSCVKVWDFKSGEHIRTIGDINHPIWLIEVSPDEKHIICGAEKTIEVWDYISGNLIRTINASEYGNSILISPDGKYIISSSRGNSIKVWDFESEELIHRLSGYCLYPVDISSDGKYIVSGSDSKRIYIWDLNNGERLIKIPTNGKEISSIKLSPDNNYIICGLKNRTIQIWDILMKKVVFSPERQKYRVLSIAASPNGKFLFASLANRFASPINNSIKVWEFETGKLIYSINNYCGKVFSIAISPDGKFFITGSYDWNVRVWDLKTGKLLRKFLGHKDIITSVAFSPNGKYIASSSYDRTVNVWDFYTGNLIRVFGKRVPEEEITQSRILERLDQSWHCVDFSKDGKYIACGSSDNSVRVWEFETGKLIHMITGHQYSVYDLVITPDSRFIISISFDSTIKIWEITTGILIRTLKGHIGSIKSVNISSDGKYIVSGGKDKSVKIWDINNGELIATFQHSHNINSVSFIPDSYFVIAGDDFGDIRVWDFQNIANEKSIQ